MADSVDWRRVKNVRTLCRISDVYKINRRYHDSKRVLELAYAKSPYGRQIIFSLCELELKLGNYVRALQLYNEYINVAPRDVDRYVLQYKLQKAQNVSVNERIAVLEEMARYDFRDKWAFELAKLYLEAGERTLCASECDEIVAFFGYGKYVYKALELKASFTELTQKQKALFRKMNGEETPESGQETASSSKDESVEGNDAPQAAQEALPARGPEEEAGQAQSGTIGAEQEKGSGAEQAYDAAGQISEGGSKEPEAAEQAQPELQPEDQGENKPDDHPVKESGKEPEPAGQESIPALNREPDVTEIPWEYEEYEVSPRELRKKTASEGKRGRNRRQEPAGSRKSQRTEIPVKSTPDHAVFEDHTFEVGGVDESMFSPEKMQETVAKGLRDLENYDTFLMQETDGQYAMVMQEEPKREKQITGQLNLEEIMQEWEKVKRDFYETNGLDADDPRDQEDDTAKVPHLMSSGEDRSGTSGTKSWDRREVHKALQIRDNDDENAGYDTSLFVTEGGGDFPEEFAVEERKVGVSQLFVHNEDRTEKLEHGDGVAWAELLPFDERVKLRHGGGRGAVLAGDAVTAVAAAHGNAPGPWSEIAGEQHLPVQVAQATHERVAQIGHRRAVVQLLYGVHAVAEILLAFGLRIAANQHLLLLGTGGFRVEKLLHQRPHLGRDGGRGLGRRQQNGRIGDGGNRRTSGPDRRRGIDRIFDRGVDRRFVRRDLVPHERHGYKHEDDEDETAKAVRLRLYGVVFNPEFSSCVAHGGGYFAAGASETTAITAARATSTTTLSAISMLKVFSFASTMVPMSPPAKETLVPARSSSIILRRSFSLRC